MIGGMFLIFVLFLALGIPIAFSVGWATLSVHIMDPTFACNAEYFFKTVGHPALRHDAGREHE